MSVSIAKIATGVSERLGGEIVLDDGKLPIELIIRATVEELDAQGFGLELVEPEEE
jgi:hypothetical protein